MLTLDEVRSLPSVETNKQYNLKKIEERCLCYINYFDILTILR